MSTHLDMELAGLLIRGELGPEESARWSEHLAGCAACQRVVEEERAMRSLLRIDAGGADDAAVERAVARLDQSFERERRRGAARQLALLTAGTAAAALLIAAGVYVWQGPDEAQRAAERLGISAALQRRIVVNLDQLETLRQNPWLSDDFETVVALQRQLEPPREAAP